MKNKFYRKLFALVLTLLIALAFAACAPQIHIHTNESSSQAASDNVEASSEAETGSKETTEASKVETSVDDSETSKKQEATSSKTSSKEASSKTTSTSSKKEATSSQATTSDNISKSKAKSIALKDAGLKESQIYDYEIELDRDNGTLHYDVSFEYNAKDYDYEINAKTGKIISVEKPKATSSEAKISKSKAKSLALNDAGVKSADVSFYESELEKDDGVWKYEISFNVGNVEYEYTINAENGKILQREKDIDD